MSKENLEIKMTKIQKEAVAEGLAQFFFDYFQNKSINKERTNQVVVQKSGFLREDFPDLKTTT